MRLIRIPLTDRKARIISSPSAKSENEGPLPRRQTESTAKRRNRRQATTVRRRPTGAPPPQAERRDDPAGVSSRTDNHIAATRRVGSALPAGAPRRRSPASREVGTEPLFSSPAAPLSVLPSQKSAFFGDLTTLGFWRNRRDHNDPNVVTNHSSILDFAEAREAAPCKRRRSMSAFTAWL